MKTRSLVRRTIRWLLASCAIGAVLFAISGRWLDPWLWAYVIVCAGVALYAVFFLDSDLARERFNPPSPGADRSSLRAIRLVAVAHVVVGALDSGRWHVTTVAPGLRFVGLIGIISTVGLILRAMAVNHFFSAVVRIQHDRGHRVVERGPYALIRHPGYAGMIAAVPLSALVLGSWISFGVALVYSALIFRRVLFEDAYLRTYLEGYNAYARRVRYRLVPGLW